MLEQYASFFAASSQASAALVGLLFVALSIDVDLERGFRFKQFAFSETAFISLGGIFIISLLALLPSGLLLMTGASIVLSVIGIWGLLRRTHPQIKLVLLPVDFWQVFVTVGVYIWLAGTSLWLLTVEESVTLLNIFCMLLGILYVLSLIRAWRSLLIIKHYMSN